MKNTINKMFNRINKVIKVLAENYAQTQQFDAPLNAKVNGMIEMLELVAGKCYYIDTTNNCLAEREDKAK